MSSPSGPTYQAATWISFQCSATSGSGIYRYKWRVYCSSTDVLIFESTAGLETSFRIKSTPSVCYDRVECVAEDTVLPLSGSASATITSVTGNHNDSLNCSAHIQFLDIGVGIFANDNPASNNSVLLADRNNQIGTISCSSGSRSSGIGQWLAPNGAVVPQSGSLLSIVHGGGSYPAYVGLQLRANQSLSASEEGIYTCVIPDVTGIQRTLHVGIYRYGYNGNAFFFNVMLCVTLCYNFVAVPAISITSTTNPMLVLRCTAMGAPGVITWAYSGSSQMYTNDGGHQIVQSLLNGVTSTLESRLTFTQNPYSRDTGSRVCVVTSTYISTNSTQTNTSTKMSKY